MRLKDGLPITRARKRKCLINDELLRKCKEKLIGGFYSPLEYITEISHTVGSLTETSTFDESSDEDEDGEVLTLILQKIQILVCVWFV